MAGAQSCIQLHQTRSRQLSALPESASAPRSPLTPGHFQCWVGPLDAATQPGLGIETCRRTSPLCLLAASGKGVFEWNKQSQLHSTLGWGLIPLLETGAQQAAEGLLSARSSVPTLPHWLLPGLMPAGWPKDQNTHRQLSWGPAGEQSISLQPHSHLTHDTHACNTHLYTDSHIYICHTTHRCTHTHLCSEGCAYMTHTHTHLPLLAVSGKQAHSSGVFCSGSSAHVVSFGYIAHRKESLPDHKQRTSQTSPVMEEPASQRQGSHAQIQPGLKAVEAWVYPF